MNPRSNTKDGKLLLVRVESDINPGEYYIYNTETNKADFLWANRSWVDPRQMRSTRNIKIKAKDGLEINGYLTMPKQNGEQSLLVVLVHGGPHGIRDYWEYNNEVKLFANRGYAVLQVNFRGSGGYGEVFEKLGYREWGGKMIDDILDATQWVLENESLDANRVCIFGGSYGGYASMIWDSEFENNSI